MERVKEGEYGGYALYMYENTTGNFAEIKKGNRDDEGE
jgi:hypothetical protein